MQYYYQVICDWDKASHCSQINKGLSKKLSSPSTSAPNPYANIATNQDPSQNLLVASSYSQQEFGHIKPHPHKTRPTKKRILKIGYLSADYKNHVIAHHIMSVFRYHNQKQFRIYAYSYGKDNYDEYRQYVKNHAHKFVDLNSLSSLEASQKIINDQIDILIDLTGYTTNGRFDILAYKPAPIQINYLGYPSTTGAKFIDYIIADPVLIPKKDQQHYSEKIVYLPYGYQISSYKELDIPPTPSRKNQGLPQNSIVFCSFNNSYKISKNIFLTWLRILKNTPDSVLWLAPLETEVKNKLINTCKQHRVNINRLIFSSFMPIEKHLARLSLADIALDTPKYNGGSTTSNALYMKVPVITVSGTHYPSRMSQALLTAVKLPQLITTSIDKYQNLAIKLAKNPKLLKSLKNSLTKNNKTNPFFNSKVMTKSLEDIYQDIWQTYTKSSS